jgi:hypothetical protein
MRETEFGAVENRGIELCKCESGKGEPAKQRKAEKAQQKKVKQSSRSKAVKQNMWLSS